MRDDIFTVIPDKEIPVSDEEIQAIQTESRNILTRRGKSMSNISLLRSLIFEALSEMPTPIAGAVYDVNGEEVEVMGAKRDMDGKLYLLVQKGNRSEYTPYETFDTSKMVSRPNVPSSTPPVMEQKRVTGTYGGKTYGASPGSVSALKKTGMSAKKAVGGGKFSWAENPYAAAQAAHIVATGEPTVKKGTKRKKASESDRKHESTCSECGAKKMERICSECGY